MVITSDKFIDFYKNRVDLTKVIFIPNKPDLNCLAKYQKKEKKPYIEYEEPDPEKVMEEFEQKKAKNQDNNRNYM